MVRHNNMIPNNHFHKNWQKSLKTWFDQPLRKARKKIKRDRRQKQLVPRPIEFLRPIITCPTIRYHTKKRIGRGFSLRELKKANIHPSYAKSIGIAVDYRRTNKSVESLQTNVYRLKEYQGKLIVFSKKGKTPITAKSVGINKIRKPVLKLKARTPTEEEKSYCAFISLRKARSDKKYLGKRIKRKNRDLQNDMEITSRKKLATGQDED